MCKDRTVTDRECRIVLNQFEKLMLEKNWSQEQAARMLEVDRTCVGKILRQKRRPSKNLLEKISFVVLTKSFK